MIKNTLIDGPIAGDTISGLIGELGARTDAGGHSLFLGQVRADVTDGKEVSAIDYSAYDSMVNAEVNMIREKLMSEFRDVKSVEIIHSRGIVRAGEISLLVLVSAGHRHEAISACSKAVELVKENLPVWKREIFKDDTYRWKDNSQD
jgi:molybdopterin synthase catalytic subunit